MREYFSRLVFINALICTVFAAVFALPIGMPIPGLTVGLLFGMGMGLSVEVILHRWKGRWLYKRRLLLLVFLEVVLVLYVMLPAFLGYVGMRPLRVPVADIPADLLEIAEEVSLQTSDGISLSGWYIAPQNGCVIITLHGLGSNRLAVLPHARLLIEQGYGVLMMDMRAHGNSGGELFVDGWNAVIDVNTMVSYLLVRPEVEHIGALGLSAGAIVILHAGAEIEAVEAFVADGTGVGGTADLLNPLIPHPAIAWLLVPDYWTSYRFMALFSRLEPLPPIREEVTQIAPRPILFVAGANSLWEPELAAKYVASAGASAEVWVIDNAGHTTGIFTAPDEYTARVLTFFDMALMQQPE